MYLLLCTVEGDDTCIRSVHYAGDELLSSRYRKPFPSKEFCLDSDEKGETVSHRRIKRQRGRQRSSLNFWLFDAARGGERGYCDTNFQEETHGNMMGFEPGTFR